MAFIEIAKGLGFVLVTSIILWAVLHRQYRSRRLSEATFRRLVESLHDAVFVVSVPERTILYASPGARHMFGYTESELVGADARMLHVSEQHDRRFDEEIGPAIAAGQPYHGEFEMRRKSGESFPTEHIVSPILDEKDTYVIGVVRDASLLKRQESAIRESEERFRQIAENLREVFWISDAGKTEIQYVSPAYEEIWGRSAEALYRDPGAFLDAVHPDDQEWVRAKVLRQSVEDYDAQYRIVRPDGVTRWIWDRSVPIRGADGSAYRVVGIAEDITELKQREADLVQAQKMEAVGQLAGGIAHDFNNMLTVILGNAELLTDALTDRPDEARQVALIIRAGERASDLTRRLLAFSRQQNVVMGPVDLNTLIGEVSGLLGHTFGEDVTIEMRLADSLWLVAADRAQIETTLLNLAINARDAMPDGGRLVIETANVSFEDARTGIGPGDFVTLAVSDTGTGMTAEVAARAFDPFFTTKEPGKGTGLGLSIIHGFVLQSGGRIDLRTAPGEGTSFRLYLPRHAGPAPVSEPPEAGAIPGGEPPEAGAVPGGDETLLVVEDDQMVRDLVTGQLRGLGYRVVEASDGASALEQLGRPREIALVLTDVIMPGGMSGPRLAVEIERRYPGMTVLFMSGYSERAEFELADLPANVTVLRKPYRLVDLARRVRAALDAHR